MPLEQQIKVVQFMSETGLSLDAVLGQNKPPPSEKVIPKWPFELGKPLVRPKLVWKLATKLYKFRQWYMEQSANDRIMFALLIKPIDFFGEGEKLL